MQVITIRQYYITMALIPIMALCLLLIPWISIEVTVVWTVLSFYVFLIFDAYAKARIWIATIRYKGKAHYMAVLLCGLAMFYCLFLICTVLWMKYVGEPSVAAGLTIFVGFFYLIGYNFFIASDFVDMIGRKTLPAGEVLVYSTMFGLSYIAYPLIIRDLKKYSSV